MTTVYRSEQIARVAVSVSVTAVHRIVPKRYLGTPLGTGPSDSRFCTHTADFTIRYAAQDFATAFVETVVRDRFTRKTRREILYKEVSERGWATLTTRPRHKLRLLDLRTDGCLRHGAPTDVVNARNHAAGRAFSHSIYTGHINIDGVLFASRLTGADVYAIFDRSIHKLAVLEVGELEANDGLPDLLRRHEIALVVHTQ